MTEQLFYNIGQQRYHADVARADRNYARRVASEIETRSNRDQIVYGLVSLAARLQPSLTVQIQRPAQPTAV